MHDISTTPSGVPTVTRQDEINELNEYDNVTQGSVSQYIEKVQGKIQKHSEEIDDEFLKVQERLLDHFKYFANTVRDKFEKEVIKIGINQEFDKLSPIKHKDTLDEEMIETGEDSRLSGIDSSDEKINPSEYLNPELNLMKNHLAKAYASPLRDYQNAINTTADFRRSTNINNDVKFMNVDQRHHKNERSASVEQRKKREDMKKRLHSHKLVNSINGKSAKKEDFIKSARCLNAFDTTDPYPDQKYAFSLATSFIPKTLTPRREANPIDIGKAINGSIYANHKVRRKKDEIVKTLLFSNRNR